MKLLNTLLIIMIAISFSSTAFASPYYQLDSTVTASSEPLDDGLEGDEEEC